MRYGIFSDIHSNLEALESILESFKTESIDKFLCIGDIVGYGADPKECIDTVTRICSVIVAGNHDWASAGLFSLSYFNPIAKEAVIWTRQNLDDNSRYFLETLRLVYKNEYLTLVHGTLDNPQDFNYMSDDYTALQTFRLLETNVCFVGHTHACEIFIKDNQGQIYYTKQDRLEVSDANMYIVNVGSVGQPRDGRPLAAYCIYDSQKKEIQIKRVGYDISSARKKIIDAGLPRSLGDRLIIGR